MKKIIFIIFLLSTSLFANNASANFQCAYYAAAANTTIGQMTSEAIAAGGYDTSYNAFGCGAYVTVFGIGRDGAVFGYSPEATGDYSTAIGNEVVTSGNYATGLGYNAISSGSYSLALGASSNTSRNYNVALGNTAGGLTRTISDVATGTLSNDAVNVSQLHSLIRQDSNGALHIGENSLVTQEVNGRQQLYATDAAGNRIDINIPSGTNLIIDGEDVMGSIDSSIALGAAFASLPTGAEGAGYTCGLGTGFHDSASAISGGCGFDFANYAFVETMPTMFQKASFNVGLASVVHGEGDDATLKAGITFKFGAPKPVREAKDNNLLLENKIDAVMAKNEAIQNENDLLKAQIAEINAQLKALNMLAMN